MKTILYLFTALLLLISVGKAQGAPATQDKPEFAGTWKLNLGKSTFGQIPPPASQTDVIALNGDELKIVSASEGPNGTRNYTLTLKLDGSETSSPVGNATPDASFQVVSAKAEWQAATLVLTEQIRVQGSPGTLRSIYALSPDGKTLTKSTQITTEMGEFAASAVFDRQ
jgi:hypothetical protein